MIAGDQCDDEPEEDTLAQADVEVEGLERLKYVVTVLNPRHGQLSAGDQKTAHKGNDVKVDDHAEEGDRRSDHSRSNEIVEDVDAHRF